MNGTLSQENKKFVTNVIGTSDFECLQLAGDASTRKYYRIVYEGQSRVLMSWEPFADDERYPFLNVQRHFATMDIRVPRVDSFSRELGAVLLEDLGDLTLERKFWENQDQRKALPYYTQAVDELIKIHFLATRPRTPAPVCQEVQFDTAKFMWEMNYAREHFLEKLAGINLPDGDQQKLQDEFHRICETLHRQPKFVCHRDYHSRNLMLKLGRIYVIDFQDARLGPVQYDLVSLVHDSYVNLSAESISAIKREYVEKANAHGPKDVIRPDFEDIFKLQIIQRCFKACGSFSSFYNTRNDTRYLKYIAPTAQLVTRTLNEVGGFPMFAKALASFDPQCVP